MVLEVLIEAAELILLQEEADALQRSLTPPEGDGASLDPGFDTFGRPAKSLPLIRKEGELALGNHIAIRIPVASGCAVLCEDALVEVVRVSPPGKAEGIVDELDANSTPAPVELNTVDEVFCVAIQIAENRRSQPSGSHPGAVNSGSWPSGCCRK